MSKIEDRLAIEFISVLGLPPVEFVGVAADLGCRHIGMALQPIVRDEAAYPAWSLKEDAALRRDMLAAMCDRDVSVSIGEGFLIWPHTDIEAFAVDLDIMQELGAPIVNSLTLDPDAARSADKFRRFAEMAAARGMRATVEFVPGMPVGTLAQALETVRRVDSPHFGVLVDMMHLARTGAGAGDLAAIDQTLIFYAQLCDVPLVSAYEDYGYEARFERLAPGKGELPLGDLMAALPKVIMVGLEVPMLAQAQAGVSPRDRLAPCLAAASILLTFVR
jgi:sugar phosphate isomerase/epimerase